MLIGAIIRIIIRLLRGGQDQTPAGERQRRGRR
jgi:hypothetical protein